MYDAHHHHLGRSSQLRWHGLIAENHSPSRARCWRPWSHGRWPASQRRGGTPNPSRRLLQCLVWSTRAARQESLQRYHRKFSMKNLHNVIWNYIIHAWNVYCSAYIIAHLHTSSHIQTEWAYQFCLKKGTGLSVLLPPDFRSRTVAADRRPYRWFYKILV